jgi:transcriptional regulator with GAF, ATPase, and Fis domain
MTSTGDVPMSDPKQNPIAAQLAALVADVQRRSMSIEDGLAELVDSASRHVPGSQYAGITLVHEGSKVTTVAATHRYPELLDEIQQRHQDGPCLSAAWEHHTVSINDVTAETRWPKYSRDVVEQTPIRSVMSFETFVNHTVMGALNFYAERPGAFNAESLEMGLVFSTHIALAWAMLRRDEQFRSALASRDVIGQAKGIIMERFGVDAVQAFELLKRLSQDSNTKLADVAHRLVEVEHPAPDE